MSAADRATATIAVRGVRFDYGRGASALVCEALDITPGMTLLLGRNGAGKSTLLKVLAGVERPPAGTVTVDGADLWRDEVAARRRLAYIPEHPDLTPYATLGEVLMLVARLRGEPAAAAERALARAGLDGLAPRSIRELSMGQRRRAMLAAAFVGAPSVLLLDEPLEAMDRAMRETIVEWLAGAASRGASVVVATHEVEPFAPLADRAIVVDAGVPHLLEPLPEEPGSRLALLDRCARGGWSPACNG